MLIDLKKNIRIFWLSFSFQIKRYGEYPFEALASLVGVGFILLTAAVYWSVIAKSPGSEVIIAEVVSYFLISMLLNFYISRPYIASQLIKLIKSGRFNQLLIQPLNPMVYIVGERLGFEAIRLVTLIAGFGLGLILSPFSINPTTLFFFIISLAIAALISFSLAKIIGSIAFYIADSNGIKNAYFHITRIGSGSIIPIFFLSETVQKVFLSLPFAHMLYVPVRIIQGGEIAMDVLIVGAGWAFYLWYLSIIIWNRSIKNYDAIGI